MFYFKWDIKNYISIPARPGLFHYLYLEDLHAEVRWGRCVTCPRISKTTSPFLGLFCYLTRRIISFRKPRGGACVILHNNLYLLVHPGLISKIYVEVRHPWFAFCSLFSEMVVQYIIKSTDHRIDMTTARFSLCTPGWLILCLITLCFSFSLSLSLFLHFSLSLAVSNIQFC